MPRIPTLSPTELVEGPRHHPVDWRSASSRRQRCGRDPLREEVTPAHGRPEPPLSSCLRPCRKGGAAELGEAPLAA